MKALFYLLIISLFSTLHLQKLDAHNPNDLVMLMNDLKISHQETNDDDEENGEQSDETITIEDRILQYKQLHNMQNILRTGNSGNSVINDCQVLFDSEQDVYNKLVSDYWSCVKNLYGSLQKKFQDPAVAKAAAALSKEIAKWSDKKYRIQNTFLYLITCGTAYSKSNPIANNPMNTCFANLVNLIWPKAKSETLDKDETAIYCQLAGIGEYVLKMKTWFNDDQDLHRLFCFNAELEFIRCGKITKEQVTYINEYFNGKTPRDILYIADWLNSQGMFIYPVLL